MITLKETLVGASVKFGRRAKLSWKKEDFFL
jgi:hypothetical protein